MKPSASGPFPYVPLPTRPKLNWPNGARLAFWVVVNFEYFPLDQKVPGGHGKVPDIVAFSRRDYGNRVGAFRIMERMAKYGVRGTANINADLCTAHPEIVAEAKRLNWEFMAHGFHQVPTHRVADQPEMIARTVAAITGTTGRPPRGWLGPGLTETLDTVARAGGGPAMRDGSVIASLESISHMEYPGDFSQLRVLKSSSIKSISAKYSVWPPLGLRKYQNKFEPKIWRPGGA